MKYTMYHRIIALLLAMMLFVSPLSPAAFAESPEMPVDTKTIQTPAEALSEPTTQPEEDTFFEPTAEPVVETTTEPTVEPTAEVTTEPTAEPTAEATVELTAEPTAEVTAEPTAEPTTEPTAEPIAEATVEPTIEPTVEPMQEPTAEPAPEAPVYQTVRDVLATGGYPYVMSSPMTLYADAELTQPVYTVTSNEAIFMVTSLIERDGLNSMEVWLLNLDYELIVAYINADALPDTALPDADVQTMAQERLSAMVFAVNGEFIVFVAEGETFLPDMPPVEEIPAHDPMPEDAPVTDAPAMDEPQEAEVPASKQIGEFVLVTPNTRVFMDVDDSASDEYLGDMYTGQFIRDAAVQIVEIKQDSLGRTWYVVDYLYGPDEGDSLICEMIGTVHVLADETQDTEATALSATDVVLPKGYSMPMLLASEDFSLRDAETGLPIILANTSFKLRDSEGNYVTQTLHYPNETQIDTYITDDTGSVTLPQTLNWGMYTVEEVHSPTGYLALDEGFSIFVGSAGDTPDNVYEVNVKIPNDPVKGRILAQKKGLQFTGVQTFTDAYGNKVHQPVYEEGYLAGATFEVRAADDVVGGDGTIWYRQGDLVDTITMTDAGADTSKELPLGKYVLIETIAPAGYVLDDTPHEVELTFMDSQTALVETSVSIGNTYLSAEIALTKEKEVLLTEEENGEVRRIITTAPGESFVFGLFTDDDLHFDGGAIMAGSLVAMGATDAEGRLTFTGSFPHGHYTIRELSAPDGWMMSKDAYPVVLNPANLDAGESVIHVTLDKPVHNALVYYAMTLTKTDIMGTQTVPGARLEVSDDDGNIIYRATTDENGEIPELFVTPGRYTFREIIAPEGYALNEAEMTFKVDKDGNVTGNTMIRDDYTRVSVLKQDESGLPMAGVEFSLLDASGNTRMTAISDMNGLATFERIPYGKYTITETQPLSGYFRSDVSVEVTVDGSFVNPTEPLATITNHPMRIECIKVDNSGRYLPGVEFSLIDARTNTIVEIVTSDEQGRFVFDAIDYGSWVIRETRAPEGYMVMEDVHLEIGEDFVQPEPITFVNVPNHYEFMKVDDRHEPLSGVTFVLEDESGNVLRELVSGEDGIVHADNLTFGSYVIRETQTLEGYKLTEETISFTIDENYVDPPELYCLVNEREPITAIIQTGVDFVMTPVTWIGAGLVLCSMILYAIWFPKKKNK